MHVPQPPAGSGLVARDLSSDVTRPRDLLASGRPVPATPGAGIKGTDRWYFRASTNELVYPSVPGVTVGYCVDLDRCGTAAAVLDWLVQVSHKRWADAGCVAGLVQALDLALDLQRSRCMGAMSERGRT